MIQRKTSQIIIQNDPTNTLSPIPNHAPTPALCAPEAVPVGDDPVLLLEAPPLALLRNASKVFEPDSTAFTENTIPL